MNWTTGIQQTLDDLEDRITDVSDYAELEIVHWYGQPDRDKHFIELWLPIEA